MLWGIKKLDLLASKPPTDAGNPSQYFLSYPRQHKAHPAVQYIPGPQLAPSCLEVIALLALCQDAPDEHRDEEGAEEVEEEAGVGL